MAMLEITALWTDGRHCPLGVDTNGPFLGWTFGQSEERSRTQSAYRIEVASSEVQLADGHADVWDSGLVKSGRHTSISYEGPALKPRQRYYWRVTVQDEKGQQSKSRVDWWEAGQLSADNWSGRWIGDPQTDVDGRRMPQFRRGFTVKGPVTRARAYISGLGHYELRLNGSKVGDYELDPGWTEYDKTVLYTVYDITAALLEGENAVGVMLGNGFYNVTGGRYVKFKDSFGSPRCLVNLVIEYANGLSETIATDGTWKVSASPLTFSCIYGGEDYDARLEQEGWDKPDYLEHEQWTEAAEVAAPLGQLTVQTAPALKIMKRFALKAVTEPKSGTFVLDLGQNFSGWPEISVSGPKGAEITLIPAEILTEDGLANQKWSGSPYELHYTLKGDGVETWRPRFTYYGLRYIQVEGAVPASQAEAKPGNQPVLQRIEGQMIYPDTPVTGGFHCSDDLLNRIHEIIDWAILSNMKSVFTDCPHREKLGWLEEIHLMGPSIMFNYDIEALLTKVMADIADAQLPNGLVPTTAPEYVVFQEPWQVFRDATAWGGTYILSAWEMLQRYGNRGVLERHYEGMKRYIDYLTANAEGFIIHEGLGDWYDIGPEGPGFSQNTPVALAETAIYYGLTVVMQKIADLLGHLDDAEIYLQLSGSIKTAFNRAFFDEQTLLYAEGSDAAHAMPLVIGLAPEQHREAILTRLVENIAARGYQTTSGDVGHRYVLLALARGGRSDVIYRMTRNTEMPSYGYQIVNGATSLTEAWDGPTVGKSQNHLMLGHLEEWLYSCLAGLDYRYQVETERFVVMVKPDVVGDITWAQAWYDLRAGRASVRWERGEDRKLMVKVEIPVNADGIIHIPAVASDGVTVDSTAAEFLRYEAGRAVYRTDSGAFTFTSWI